MLANLLSRTFESEKALELVDKVIRMGTKNPSIRQILDLSREEQRRFLAYHLEHNVKLNATPEAQSKTADRYDAGIGLGLVHSNHQLPCSEGTRRKRADLIEQLGFGERNVLLMGDDDLVSVELARRGHPGIEVADCDAKLIRTIHRLVARLPGNVVTTVADFRHESTFRRRPDLVLMDPPYNTEGVRTFLSAAVPDAAAAHKPEVILLMMPSQAVGKMGWMAINQSFNVAGYDLEKHHEHFNSYPIGSFSSLILKSSSMVLFREQSKAISETPMKFFGSDCFVFRAR